MATNLFDRLSPKAAFLSSLLSNAGLNVEELIAKNDANALKAHLDSIKTNPDLAKAINEATQKLQQENGELLAKVTKLEGEKNISTITIGALTNAITATTGANSVTIAADGKVDEVAIKTAHTAAVSKAARDMVAKAGHPGLLDDPSLDPTKQQKVQQKDENKPERTGRERMAAAFNIEIAALNAQSRRDRRSN